MNASEAAYQQTLDYLYSFVDYSLKKSSELAKASFNLERMYTLLAALGQPQNRYPAIHVAGTKGKGSVCALCASALRAAGHRTGLYISPHLQDFAERIQVNGQPIPHTTLTTLVEEIKPVVAGIASLTFFEITTALAFLYFARQGVDAAVIEVGLGGRLDATNVITPRVSVITSLSYDHMAVLGNTLSAIAAEKAGIIKERIPVVSAPQPDEALTVLERIAAERHAPLTLVGRDVHFRALEHSLDGQRLQIEAPVSLPLRIPLLGRHQVVNAVTAWAALQASGLKVPSEAIQAGFADVVWPCRFEVAHRQPPLVLDSAHNVDSFEKLSQTLADYFPTYPVTLIFGCSEDKNMAAMLAALKGQLKRVLATRAAHPRAVGPQAIVVVAGQLGIPAEVVTPVEAALRHALALAEEEQTLILSAGSMFVTAEVKTAWQTFQNASSP